MGRTVPWLKELESKLGLDKESYLGVSVPYSGSKIAIDRLKREGFATSDDPDCVPPSLEEAVTARWELFTEAWYERDRQGGGEELGHLAELVTDDFADTLRGLPPRDPVPDPAPFTNFELVTATRTSATGQACRSDGLETIEWTLVDGQWRVDFTGQVGEEATPCP